MVTVPAVLAVCFRCDWTGQTDAGRGDHICPRCGVPLYLEPDAPRYMEAPQAAVSSPPSPVTDHREIESPGAQVSGEGTEYPSDSSSDSLARMVLGMAGVIVAFLALMGLTRQQNSGDLTRDSSAETVSLGATTQRLALSTETSGALIPHVESVTFVAENQAPGEASPTLRLWRLVARNGRLLSGPVVTQVRDLHVDPSARSDRLAYLTEDGELFSLHGFHAARPARIGGDVEAFHFARDGSLVYAPVEEEPLGSRVQLHVRVVRTDPQLHTHPESSFTTRLDVDDPYGLEVREQAFYVWGSDGLRSELATASPSSPEPVRVVARGYLLGIGPKGELLATSHPAAGDRVALLAPKPSSEWQPLRGGFLPLDVLAWSDDGSAVAAIGTRDGDARSGLWAVPTGLQPGRPANANAFDKPLWVGPGSPEQTFAAFSPDGRLLFWTSGNAVRFIDVRSGEAFRISLPPYFTTAGPIVAA